MFSFVSVLHCYRAVRSRSRSPARAQQTVDVGSVSGRVVDESGAAVPGAIGHGHASRHQHRGVGGHRQRRAASGSRICKIGVYDLAVIARRLQGRDARQLTVSGGLRVRDADRAGARRHRIQRHRDGRSAGDRSRAQPDRRHGLEAGSRGAADERPQLPRARAARAGRRRRPTSPARSCSRRPRRSPASRSRSAASATCRTTSSSTACRPTTMRRD